MLMLGSMLKEQLFREHKLKPVNELQQKLKRGVEKAAAEAKERAATEAKEKEARGKTAAMRAEAEYKHPDEQAAVESSASESRERVATEIQERVAAAIKLNQQNDDTDLESFFSMGRASIAPWPEDPCLFGKFRTMQDQELQRICHL